jgi:hypothetical protein
MFDTSPWTYFLLSIGVLTVYWSISILRGAYRSDLTSLPGPKWAPFTALYRVYRLWSGQAPAVYLDLHEQYGPIVRTGPNTISIADPATIPTLYGISSNFLKVINQSVSISVILIPYSLNSTSR